MGTNFFVIVHFIFSKLKHLTYNSRLRYLPLITVPFFATIKMYGESCIIVTGVLSITKGVFSRTAVLIAPAIICSSLGLTGEFKITL